MIACSPPVLAIVAAAACGCGRLEFGPVADVRADGPVGSCTSLPDTCGQGGNHDCCESVVVPGGTFNRTNDPAFPATVSSFRLDVYEVSVGRFRAFVDAG